mmetsp:Transcript_20987/g.41151  ORF Transcript_20987/g.41151 Transcript_20987/m.41151 type:complete len:390 (+) Transcript_20987:213-1382(+)
MATSATPSPANGTTTAASPSTEDHSSRRNRSASADRGFVHVVKRMQFLNREVSVVMQNENGPCPLVALVNALVLRGTLRMHPDRTTIGSENLIAMIADCLLEKNAIGNDENVRQSIEDIIEMLPSLQYGLDVNVRFQDVTSFEYDSHIAVFDLLGVNLFHGWVVDKDDTEAYGVLGQLSYNQAMDRIIHAREAEEGGTMESGELVRVVHDADVIQKFLADSASQFTFTGLMQLHHKIKERELCTFFRNNHFSTLFKLNDDLFLLVTDQGYSENSMIGWELLNAVNGDTELVSPSFGRPDEYVHPNDLGQVLEDQRGLPSRPGATFDADAELAQQIAAEEEQQAGHGGHHLVGGRHHRGNRQEQEMQNIQRARSRPTSPNNRNKGGCVIA